MKNKLLNIAIIIFSLLFLFYPLIYGLSSIKGIIIILLILILTLKFIYPKLKKYVKIKEKYYIPIIVILFIITRIISIFALNNNILQISDFNSALEAAKTLEFQTLYYKNFVHWIFQPVVHHYLLGWFGINQLSIMIFNTILTLGVTIGIYKVTEYLTDSKSTSFISALIYTLWPANIIYIGINTPEHIGSLLLIIATYFILKIFKNNELEKGIIYSLLSGIILGLSVFFKNFALVFIIAFVIYIIMYFIKNKFKAKELRNFIIYLLIIIGSYSVVTNGMYNIADKLVGEEVNRSIAPCYMLVGLHSTGAGIYNPELYKTYFDTVEELGYEKGNKKVLEILFDDIKENDKFLTLLDDKAVSLHSYDNRVDWVSQSALANESKVLYDFLKEEYQEVNDYYYLLVIILIIMSVFYLIKKKNIKILFISLIIFGSSLLLLLVESQARYTYSLLPFYCVLATIGLVESNNIINKKYN